MSIIFGVQMSYCHFKHIFHCIYMYHKFIYLVMISSFHVSYRHFQTHFLPYIMYHFIYHITHRFFFIIDHIVVLYIISSSHTHLSFFFIISSFVSHINFHIFCHHFIYIYISSFHICIACVHGECASLS